MKALPVNNYVQFSRLEKSNTRRTKGREGDKASARISEQGKSAENGCINAGGGGRREEEGV